MYCGGKIAAEVAVKIVVDPGEAVLMGGKSAGSASRSSMTGKGPGRCAEADVAPARPGPAGTPLKGLGTWPAMTATPRTSLHNTPQPTVDITSSRASKEARGMNSSSGIRSTDRPGRAKRNVELSAEVSRCPHPNIS